MEIRKSGPLVEFLEDLLSCCGIHFPKIHADPNGFVNIQE